jgi:hypothetical protein
MQRRGKLHFTEHDSPVGIVLPFLFKSPHPIEDHGRDAFKQFLVLVGAVCGEGFSVNQTRDELEVTHALGYVFFRNRPFSSWGEVQALGSGSG